MVIKSKLRNFASRLIPHRMWVQVSFLAVWLLPLQGRLHTMCSPVFHCYACPLSTFACPIGIMAQFGAVHVFPFVAVGLLIALGALFGTLICGWVCPFGFLQDMAAKVPTPKFDLPIWTGYFRYVVLIGTVILIPYLFGKEHPLFICSICPAGALEGAAPNVVSAAIKGDPIVWPNWIKITVLGTFLGAIFFIRRPWCRLFCPLGAIFSLFNRVSAVFLKLDATACSSCGQCHKMCEYGGAPDKGPSSLNCVRCLKCTNCGPGALSFGTIFDKKKLEPVEAEVAKRGRTAALHK